MTMLSVCDKNRVFQRDLTEDDEQIVRLAFGCNANSAYKDEGRRLIQSLRREQLWLLCDCKLNGDRRPALFPTIDGFIRREEQENKNLHADGCDFVHLGSRHTDDPDTRRPSTPDNRIFRLLSKYSDKEPEPRGPDTHEREGKRESSLARLLYELIHTARLDRVYSRASLYAASLEEGRAERDAAYENIKQAAQTCFLAKNIPVSDWLATSPEEYPALLEKLGQNESGWDNPHGIYLNVFDHIEDKRLFKRTGRLFNEVRGSFPIYRSHQPSKELPCLLIGLIAPMDFHHNEIGFVRAYGHPCVDWTNLMLLDSKNELHTLRLLMSIRDRLSANFGATITIEKPVIDIGTSYITEETKGFCRPDFILHCHRQNAPNKWVVVETMGYDHDSDFAPDYRERKLRMRPAFESIRNCTNVPVIEHDYFQSGLSRDEVDRKFETDLTHAVLSG